MGGKEITRRVRKKQNEGSEKVQIVIEKNQKEKWRTSRGGVELYECDAVEGIPRKKEI